MSAPLVSVILPTYNGEATVRDALNSVLAQTYQPIEIIVVDDASTDSTPRILQEYAASIRLIQRQQNSGICAVARNQAMNAASGKYHAFIDQDDLWEPAKLEKQVAFLEAHLEIPLCHTYMRVMDDRGMTDEIRHDGNIPSTGMCAKELLQHCFITISSILVRPRDWITSRRAVGLENANADTETFLHLLQRHPAGFGFIPEVLGAYRRWSKSMSRQRWRWGPEDVNVLERVWHKKYWEGLLPAHEVKQAIATACQTNAVHWRHAGWPGRSLHYVRKGLAFSPLHAPLYGSGIKALVKGILGGGFALESKQASAPPNASA